MYACICVTNLFVVLLVKLVMIIASSKEGIVLLFPGCEIYFFLDLFSSNLPLSKAALIYKAQLYLRIILFHFIYLFC